MKKKSGREAPQKRRSSKETVVYSFNDTDIVFTSYPEGMQLEDNSESLMSYISKIIQWHYDRNLIEGSTDKDQTLKLAQELGELSDSVCKGKSVADDIGDMMVVLINIAERNKLRLVDCLEVAWNDIKDRKGKMVDGIFVKEES